MLCRESENRFHKTILLNLISKKIVYYGEPDFRVLLSEKNKKMDKQNTKIFFGQILVKITCIGKKTILIIRTDMDGNDMTVRFLV